MCIGIGYFFHFGKHGFSMTGIIVSDFGDFSEGIHTSVGNVIALRIHFLKLLLVSVNND